LRIGGATTLAAAGLNCWYRECLHSSVYILVT
jgi:hypothetical protein